MRVILPTTSPLGTACLSVSFVATTTDTVTVAADLDGFLFYFGRSNSIVINQRMIIPLVVYYCNNLKNFHQPKKTLTCDVTCFSTENWFLTDKPGH